MKQDEVLWLLKIFWYFTRSSTHVCGERVQESQQRWWGSPRFDVEDGDTEVHPGSGEWEGVPQRREAGGPAGAGAGGGRVRGGHHWQCRRRQEYLQPGRSKEWNNKKHINTMTSIQGWEPKSADRALGVLLISHLQSPVSFIPRRIFRNQFYCSTSRNSILWALRKWKSLEICMPGNRRYGSFIFLWSAKRIILASCKKKFSLKNICFG